MKSDERNAADTSPSLLARVRDPADQQAWRELEARYGELILRYARRRGMQPSDAEDVRQMVWIDLARGLRNFEYDSKRGRFRDYLGRVVRNAVSRFVRRRNPDNQQLGTTLLAVTPDNSDSLDEAWHDEWMSHHYRLAMETINKTFEENSVIVFQRLLGGDKSDAIAAELDMSQQAIYQIKFRIQQRMRELIARQIREEDGVEAVA